jgi:proline iminopeptidase
VKKKITRRRVRREGELYLPIEPFSTAMLKVPGGHRISVELYGNPKGIPVIYCHGGPGGGSNPNNARNFDPKKYFIFVFDQRGCGESVPFGSTENNTTWDLVADMECIRETFGIRRWVVFGGSWGSTLSLAYAQAHPERVRALIVSGISFGTKEEVDWFHRGGAGRFLPEYWKPLVAHIPSKERHDLLAAYFKRVSSPRAAVRMKAAKLWTSFELAALKMNLDKKFIKKIAGGKIGVAITKLECHYFLNNCFFQGRNQLLRNMHKIAHIPGVIVHGRHDLVCPVSAAFALHEVWPRSKLVIVPDAGHSASDGGTTRALIAATDSFAKRHKR